MGTGITPQREDDLGSSLNPNFGKLRVQNKAKKTNTDEEFQQDIQGTTGQTKPPSGRQGGILGN